MTLKTWTEEFYPVKPSKRMTKKQAVEHSLKKWQGLKKSNLKKHGVENIGYGEIADDFFSFGIDMSSCALCKKYYKEGEFDGCRICPLRNLLSTDCDKPEQPYDIWYDTYNPLPMIKALKQLLKEL